MILNIIEEIKKLENNFKNSLYSNVYDKYLNGECQSLVRYLYLLNNQEGTEVEITGISEDITSDFDEKVFHYVYHFNNKYYDINGEFDSIDELIKESCLFDYILSTKEQKINTFKIENSKTFKELKEKLCII